MSFNDKKEIRPMVESGNYETYITEKEVIGTGILSFEKIREDDKIDDVIEVKTPKELKQLFNEGMGTNH
jgi:hypothetical protein